jgi:hypothetical protein
MSLFLSARGAPHALGMRPSARPLKRPRTSSKDRNNRFESVYADADPVERVKYGVLNMAADPNGNVWVCMCVCVCVRVRVGVCGCVGV